MSTTIEDVLVVNNEIVSKVTREVTIDINSISPIGSEKLEKIINEMEADDSMSDPAIAETWCYFKRALIIAKKEEAKNV